MKKKLSMLLSLVLTVYLLSSSLTAFAATNSVAGTEGEDTISEDTTSTVEVEVSVESTFVVKIPKRIVLDGETKTGTYSLAVKGDIAVKETVSVIAPETFELAKEGGEPIGATNEMEKTTWSSSEINAADYVVASANTITVEEEEFPAGEYTGDLVFTIALEYEKPGLYDTNGVLLCSWEASSIDTGVDYTDENYATSTTSPNYVLTNSYAGCTEVILPESVTQIGSRAFKNCTGLTSIIIKGTVTSIEVEAFAGCTNLTSIQYKGEVYTDAAALKTAVEADGGNVEAGYWTN